MARRSLFQIHAYFYRPEVGKHGVIPLAHRGEVTKEAAETVRQDLNRRIAKTGEFSALVATLGYIPHVSTLHITENRRGGRVLAQTNAPTFEVVD